MDRIDNLKSQVCTILRDTTYEDPQEQRAKFVQMMRGIIEVVEEAHRDELEGMDDILLKAESVLSNIVSEVYSGDHMDSLYDSVESFAHTDARPLCSVARGEYEAGFLPDQASRFATAVMKFLLKDLGALPEDIASNPGMKALSPLKPWKADQRLHPSSTRCARFQDEIPGTWSSLDDHMKALSVYEARAEVSSENIYNPAAIYASSSGRGIMMPVMGGDRDQEPYVSVFFPDNGTERDMGGLHQRLDLGEIAYDAAIDDNTGLLFVGDPKRIQVYSWLNTATNATREKLARVRTIKSGQFQDAIAVLPNNRVARAGKKKIGIWDVEDVSGGSTPTLTINMGAESFQIRRWHPHPSRPSIMIAASNAFMTGRYLCRGLDLEDNGKVTTRYLGHGGHVNQISTSKGDMNVFSTAATDGYARLYDVRHPLPTMTLQPARVNDNCAAAVLCHPDGIPFIFLSDNASETIMLWDLRAQAPVYELATGNNVVTGLIWNDERNELFAATECKYLDSRGYNFGYREARIPRQRDAAEESSIGDGEDDGDDLAYTDQCWPSRAFHNETFFGHTFDSGTHRLYRYVFKEVPNLSVVPEDGGARNSGWGGGSMFW